jgi:DNA-binding NarL/FixJ family response regulator
MHPVRVLIVEHETLTRIGVRAVLGQDDVEVVAEAETAAEGFELFKAVKPDVTIMALRMPDSCAIDDLGGYFIENPGARIIVLADHAGDAEITRALKKGALGYVCKDIRPYELIKAVHTVAAGRKYIPPDIAGILSEHLGEEELTPSEQSVLRMIVGGMSNKEIAFALDITENTVKTHIKNIFEKIGVSDRTSAATMAIKRGLVRIDL